MDTQKSKEGYRAALNWPLLIAGISYWGYVNLLFSFSSIHPSEAAPSGPDAIWFYSLFGNLVALFLAALRPSKEAHAVGNAAWVTVSCAFLVVGASMLFAIKLQLIAPVLLPLAGALAGFGTGFSFVFFAELFSGMRLQMVLLYAGAHQFFGVLLYLVIALLPPAFVLGFTVVLILVYGFLFARLGNSQKGAPGALIDRVVVQSDVTLPVFVVAALFVGACYGLVRALTIGFTPTMTVLSPTDSLGGLAGGALLMLSALLFIKKNPAEYLYQIAIPVLALGLVTVPLLASGIPVALPILLACSSYFYGLLWFFVVLACANSTTSVTRIGALSFFCFQLGQLMGTILIGAIPDVAMGLYAVSVVALFAAVVLLVLVFSKQKKSELLLLKKAEESKFELGCERVVRAFALTQRESEIFRLLALGVNAKQIAKRLVLSENTVKTHIRHIYQKLGIHSRSEMEELLDEETAALGRDGASIGLPFS